jgi:UDP-N-acetylglucosamine--N-acetylmuramyl-(pentapeptide) pyrophosphoryl-undecaprenol N-acetylglucosamine transferase
MSLRIVFAGGGTGGHVYPALAVAEELRRRHADFDALFIGTRAGLESRVIGEANFSIRFIFSRGVRGRGMAGKVLTCASLLVGFVQSLKILSAFKPDLVFGSGGYASAAVVLAASALNYTIVLQEQNSIPGLTNRLLASRAKRIYLGFERARARFKKREGIIVTGNPLRREIVHPPEMDPRTAFGLDAERPVLLVFGGSQGAHRLNVAAIHYLETRTGIQAIIQTGERDYQWAKGRLEAIGARVHASPYISNIHIAYQAATVALARAGALSISELAAVQLPAILVPYPYAADNHQQHNAALLADAGGAVIIDDAELDGGSFATRLDSLLTGDSAVREEMRRALARVARSDAGAAICDDIESILGKRGDGFSSPEQPLGGEEGR